MDNQQGLPVEHRRHCSMWCGRLVGRGVWGRMDTCMCMAESFCCPPENYLNIVNWLYSNNKQTKKKNWMGSPMLKITGIPSPHKIFISFVQQMVHKRQHNRTARLLVSFSQQATNSRRSEFSTYTPVSALCLIHRESSHICWEVLLF